MESYTIIVLLFGILILFLLIMTYFINRIVQYQNKINKSFQTVEDHLTERTILLEDMINFLKQNLDHEQSYQKKLKEVKDQIITIKNNKEGINLLKKTEKDFLSFTKLENTYQDLNKNKEYLQIKNNILSNHERLTYAFDSYDKGVINYNNYRENKLISILSKLIKVPEYDCYNK